MDSQHTPIFHESVSHASGVSFSRHSEGCSNQEVGGVVTNSVISQELILSVAWWCGKLGAAYYNTLTHELHVIPDIIENASDISVLRALFFQLQPHTLIIKQNLDEKRMGNICQLVDISPDMVDQPTDTHTLGNTDFLSNMRSSFNEVNRSQHPTANQSTSSMRCYVNEKDSSCHLHIVPSSYYNADAATRRLRALRLGITPHDMTEIERWIHLKSLFPFDYPALLQATGALLKVLEQWRRGQDVDRLSAATLDDISMTVFSIRTCQIYDSLWMDQSAFLSLKIFSQESHPSAFKKGQSQSAKEGLSLFGIASKCYSTPGSLCLKNMFLRPIRNVETLKERYSVIRYCNGPSNVEVVRSFIGVLKNISDVKVSISNISTMRGTVNDWKKIQMTAKNLIALAEKCKLLPQNIRLFHQLAENERSGKWYHVVRVIHRLINFQESKRAGRCVVNSGVDEDLDRLKRDHSNMHQVYTETVNLEMENLPPCIEQGVIEFLPHVGHCLCLRSWLPDDQNMTTESVSIPGLELKFFTKENVYFKSQRCNELDETFGDVAAEIVAHEMSIMLSGSKIVLEHCGALIEGIELAGYLDALLSLSVLSLEFDMVEPELIENENSLIHIENGRHILLQLVAERFHPNSSYLGGESEDAKRINIIAGPNSSGKSVYLKQIALIVYLAQIGCFVPATSARLTPLKHIFVVSHSPETVVASLSHFGVELSMMSVATREATSDSLIILDEFGIGSSHVDGSALFISLMEHWMKLGDRSPLILVATHMHSAVEYLSRSAFIHNTRFTSMRYILDDEQLVFLYQLVDDTCANSFPLSVAYAAGLPDFAINRSQEILRAVENFGKLTPNNVLWNEAKCLILRKVAELFFFIDPANLYDLRQFVRKRVLGRLGPVPQE